MTYKTLYTEYGRTRLAQAIASGQAVVLPQMAIGDGAGNPTTPVDTQTQLVRERYRAPINRLYPHPSGGGRFVAELRIPASATGFTMREVGLFDDAGSLFLVGNLPGIPKPMASDGAFTDAIVRVEFVASNASVITLLIDPNTVTASQSWVINYATAANVIPGGTTGQHLAKASNADGDYVWEDPSTANVVVDVVEETQTLAAGQTAILLSTVTTRGLSVDIEGVRLRADQWTANPTDETQLTLGQAYSSGTKITFRQNEPLGAVPYPLVRSLNLSDVPNKPLALANLGGATLAALDERVPPGVVFPFAFQLTPSGWLKCNGAEVSRTAYAALFGKIGTAFGAGDGFNTFNLPDLRGEFVRGWDDGRGVDTGRVFGSSQAATRVIADWGASGTGRDSIVNGGLETAMADYDAGTLANTYSATETRYGGSPGGTFVMTTKAARVRSRNVALLYCIKY